MTAQLFPVQNAETLNASRALLRDIWQIAELSGLFIPVWLEGQSLPESRLLEDPALLDHADPFSPAMPVNHAVAALDALRSKGETRIGVFLRPCEWRTLQVLSPEEPLNTFSISADCTGALTEEDFLLLADGAPHELTHQVLHFAAQGGILPSRRQASCQLCEDPFPDGVDLHFELFGVATGENLLLNFRDPSLAQKVASRNDGGNVPGHLSERREHVLADLARWRANSFEKRLEQLGSDLISFDNLVAHLSSCESCQATLKKHCPLVEMEIIVEGGEAARAELESWVRSCAGCGVCDRACPEDYPLFSVIFALRGDL